MTKITINKTQEVIDVKFSELPEVTQEFIVSYGLRQILNDCHSSVQKKDFEDNDEFIQAVTNKVESKLGALLSGDITTRKAGVRMPTDPLQAMILTIARDEIKTAMKAKGLTIKAIGNEQYNTLVEGHKTGNLERITTEAQARINNVRQVEVDLSEWLEE